MVEIYSYFNDPSLSIKVTDETTKLTPHTFLPNNKMWEEDSIKYFYEMLLEMNPSTSKTIVDIGAQSGLYTLFAKFLPNCKFHSNRSRIHSNF
jgi:hypothetical protein